MSGKSDASPSGPGPVPVDSLKVLLAQSGDREALGSLLKDYQAPLFSHLKRMLGNVPDAEECLQDTFVQIIRKIKFLKEPAFFKAWAYRIATRTAYAKASKFRMVGLEEIGDEAGVLTETSSTFAPTQLSVDAKNDLTKLLEKIPAVCRIVVQLHFVDGLQLQEVARELDIPLGTVKSRLNAAKNYLLASARFLA